MPDIRKNKKLWCREAVLMGGIAVDMCLTCSLKQHNDDFLCEGCPQAWRKRPGWPHEEYYEVPVHGRGSA